MFAALDVGGTKTLLAVFDEDGKIVEESKFPTPKNYEAFKAELAENVAKLSTKKFENGAVGIRGTVDRKAGFSVSDRILKWGEIPIRDDCQKTFGCPFLIENDSKLAGLSEARLLGDEFSKVLYLTISTGIGSAFVVNGDLDQDTINSEVGKSLYEHDGELKLWEDFASGSAIVTKYHKRASEIDDADEWKEISRNIALGLINVIAAFTPEVVIIGGGVGVHFNKFSKPLHQALRSIKPSEVTLPVLRAAQRPEEAVIYGCYELARQSHAKSSK